MAGRVAGLTYIGSGLLAMAFLLLPVPPELDRKALLVVATIPVFVGALAWFAPWHRWPWQAGLGMVVLGFVFLGTANYFGAVRYASIFFVMTFAWIGHGYGQWTSVLLAPLATAAYVVPLLLRGHTVPGDLSSAAITVPVSLLVGETMALIATRLRRTQRALVESERRSSEAFRREREVSEKLRALDEVKNTFLQAVSHELRTPLTAILGCALTLEEESLDLSRAETRDLARRTALNARKLDRLLSDLLDLDRLQRGITVPQRRPTDVPALVRQMIEESDVFGERPVRIEAEPVIAPVDPAKVERIVENLLANAVKHTPPGSPVLVRITAEPGGLLLAVDDEGPGVPDDMKEAVFDPFHRGSFPSHEAPGTGIGLTLVARFAALHGGRAWVEDRAGGGASFRVFLPVEPSGPGDPGVRDRTPGDVPLAR
jgi:signal transduction histidine kinase